MDNYSAASAVLQQAAQVNALEVQATTKRWARLRVTEEISCFDLHPGDQLYIEAAAPEEGWITVARSGLLERYSGQPDAFGVVYLLEGRAFH